MCKDSSGLQCAQDDYLYYLMIWSYNNNSLHIQVYILKLQFRDVYIPPKDGLKSTAYHTCPTLYMRGGRGVSCLVAFDKALQNKVDNFCDINSSDCMDFKRYSFVKASFDWP